MSQPPQGLPEPSDFKLENMTREELKRIEKSMKQPEFMGLLNQYMVEISDPKNREQYDQYLRQMQNEGQLPKYMKLAQLTPHFCIRTHIVSQKNKKHNMKFFINYCSTEFLEEPICEPAPNQQGKTSFGWKVPNSMGKIRYDQDKHGNPCQVADVAFNPKAFDIITAESNLPFRKSQFKSMIISIGLQCAQKQLGQRKQTLSKDFDILKNVKCKGEKPALLPLRYISGKAYNKGQGPNQNAIQRDLEGKQTKLQKQINQQKEQHQKQKENEQKIKDTMQEENLQEQLEGKKPLVQDLDEGIQQPKYSSIYTYPIDYSEYMQDPSYMKSAKIPTHFTVQFKLPRVESMQQIGGDSLNINENRIVLKIGQKYFIDLTFDTFKTKYKLLTENVKAKFDKKKKILKLIFPIDQSIKYFFQSVPKAAQNEQTEEQQQQTIVQNETWKNQVLQVSEPHVNLKVIDQKQGKQQQSQSKPQKKLVQQIDEDDVAEEQNASTAPQNNKGENNLQNTLQRQKNNAFSLRNYYKKTDISRELFQEKTNQPKKLEYVFQETADKVVLVFKLPTYKKEQIEFVYDELQLDRFYLEWNNQEQDEKNPSKIHFRALKINNQKAKDVKRVEFVFRIGFVAIFIQKQNKNKFWQKESICEIILTPKESLSSYELFLKEMNQLKQLNRQRNQHKKIQQEKQKEILNQKNKENIEGRQQISKTDQATQKANDISTKKINKENQPEQITQYQKKRNMQQMDEPQKQNLQSDDSKILKKQTEIFDSDNLPPQFIDFLSQVTFIEEID